MGSGINRATDGRGVTCGAAAGGAGHPGAAGPVDAGQWWTRVFRP
ncbi:hypothetical protein SAMN06265355_11324 [Actinomadura mexicana]|uniref:Uncharacterized protein n=1 Tax=Actinomadura mexicana TaxID=134959 RepID=A0A239CQ32_9ACTN|nr:hypothetical protein SAMN06265355_11324 [Actinomadura mexicana]